jgi:hypothetical protein
VLRTYKRLLLVTQSGSNPPTRERQEFLNVQFSHDGGRLVELLFLESGRVIGFPIGRIHSYEGEPA